MAAKPNSKTEPKPEAAGITALSVSGFKSIYDECRLEIRPLTILAGANSSGKSSAMQPLLLLKQTLQATYDPGALLLDGPNVRMTKADQLLSSMAGRGQAESFRICIGLSEHVELELLFRPLPGRGFTIAQMNHVSPKTGQRFCFSENLTEEEIRAILAAFPPPFGSPKDAHEFTVEENRCFFELHHRKPGQETPGKLMYAGQFERPIRSVIHVPGLRGNPSRTYRVSATGPDFPGTFENYVASVIARWQSEQQEQVTSLAAVLLRLGLTSAVVARSLDETQIELKVGRLLRPSGKGTPELVSIADVGFGVSQALPVTVALLAAAPGQLVYLEQPELHLHPRAQTALAEVLADAAKRGVRVVAETHSSLLLLGIQTLVAEGKLSPDLVKFHWFSRDRDGATRVASAELDKAGAFGDWPEDFGDVELKAESRFLDASERHLIGG